MDSNGSRDHSPTGAPFNSSLEDQGFYWESEVTKILVPSISALVCCVGLTANAMVIYVILKHAKMKTATNIYILNLAMAQDLFMPSLPFLATSVALRHWPSGSLMCRLVLSADGLNMFTSVFCLTVLSVDRYVALVHPIKAARYRRPAVARTVNASVWAPPLVLILPIAVFANTIPTPDGGVDCNFLWPEAVWSEAFVVYTFLLPVGAICLCCCLMVAGMRLKVSWLQRRRSEKKTTRVVLLAVAVFILCWMPFYVVQLVSVFYRPLDPMVTQLLVILSYANSGANPTLYGFLLDNFHRPFQRSVSFRWLEPDPDAGQVDYCTVDLKRSASCSPLDLPEGCRTSETVLRNTTV